VRPEDIIADFLERLDLTKTSADDAARDLIEALEREGLAIDYPMEDCC
jgi:hypothetical protein